jgi:fluoroquinolone transport system ATP-binding protein
MIEVKNLYFTYKGSHEPAVKNLNFKVNSGEIFGFLGPSGAGKSTSQKILIGLLTGYEGEIRVFGKDLKNKNSSYYDHIGICFELPNHYLKLTAVENLKFFSSFYNVPVADPYELLKKVGLENDADKKVENFSKGMKMRLNFIRSLIHNPQLLFLDEPTSGLDPVNAKNIKDIILDLKKQGKTIFLTTHNMHDADELCDRVAFINEGEVKIIDSPYRLKLENGKRTVRLEYFNGTANEKNFDMDTLGSNPEFLSIVQNYKLISIHSEEASLNDVFIKVTGTSLKHNNGE